MLFNSLSYIAFMLAALLLAALLRGRARTYMFGAMSIAFYSFWRWEFSLLVIFSALVDYLVARSIVAVAGPWRRRLLLMASLSINLGLLVYFKYADFLRESLYQALGLVMESPPAFAAWDLVLPLGISFYTFQTISYTIDVYRGVTRPTRDFGLFLTYVSFWPQLIAGPVLRANEVIPQLENPSKPSAEMFVSGLERFLLGLFKKVVLADTLALVVDDLYAQSPETWGAASANEVWLAAFLFGFQIYFDFSAYSDIAIGSARMLGISFPENFNWPYLARSPKEFWERWHISLSSWIRDYLYLPLVGRKFHTHSTGGIAAAVGEKRLGRFWALLITWLLMGLWHGAGWNFALWGLYHACVILLGRMVWRLGPPQAAVGRWAGLAGSVAGWFATLFLSMAGWLFFRAQSLEQLWAMLGRLLNPAAYLLYPRSHMTEYLTCFGLIAGMILLHRIRALAAPLIATRHPSALAGHAVLMAVITAAVLTFLRPVNQFIYFQF